MAEENKPLSGQKLSDALKKNVREWRIRMGYLKE